MTAWGCVENGGPVLIDTPGIATPEPLAPIPSSEQLTWQTQELSAFLHLGLKYLLRSGAGRRSVSPQLFNPIGLDAAQWMATLRSAGFRQAMLTASTRWICLWQSQCTDYSVSQQPLARRQGRRRRAVVAAAHQANIRVGLALSPWTTRTDLRSADYQRSSSASSPSFEQLRPCRRDLVVGTTRRPSRVRLECHPAPRASAYSHRRWSTSPNVDASGRCRRAQSGQCLPVPSFVEQTSVTRTPVTRRSRPSWYPAEAVYSIRPGCSGMPPKTQAADAEPAGRFFTTVPWG